MSRTKTRAKTQKPPKEIAATLKRLEQKDPGLKQFLKKAYGYAVFPSVGKAALVVGGAYGHGEVFERGKHIGHATIGQTTLGVQVGGDTFSEVIAFENKQALERFKQGKVRFAANASAVMVKAGAAATANYEKGVAVFAYASGGMLLELSIGGQKFKFKPVSKSGEASADDKKQADQQDEHGEAGEQNQQQAPRGLLRGAASKATGFVTNHPFVAATAGLVAGFFVLRALYRVGLEDLQNQRGGDEGSQDSQAEDQQQEKDDDGEDQDDLHSMRRKRSMA